MYKIKMINQAISTNTFASSFEEMLGLIKKWRQTYGEPLVLVVNKENHVEKE